MEFHEIALLTEEESRERLEKIRWPHGAACIHCGSMEVTSLKNKASGGRKKRDGLYKCKDCRKQFTVTVGTVFEGSRIPIKKWLMAFSLICASKKGISTHQLHRMLGITYKAAWHMCHRIRYAMTQEPLKGMLKGNVEADETYVGGKFANRRNNKRFSIVKTPVVALIERNGKARTKVISNITSDNLRDALVKNVDKDSNLYTDELPAYKTLGKLFNKHKTVTHSHHEYVKGDAYTNTCECFFSLLKRGIMGSFHHVSPEHLSRYADEFTFSWNTRKLTDAQRTVAAIKLVEGKRLMYKEPKKDRELGDHNCETPNC